MKTLVVANWKCNPIALAEAKQLSSSVKRGIQNIRNVEVVICPPFVYLPLLKANGAQDVFWEEKGAFTGEISPLMLKDLGCQYVIIGHSERRKLGETDEMINKKLKAALKVKLKPILCIGETEKERRAGETFKILKNQIQKVLFKNSSVLISHQSSLIIAYEPVWAIGTGNPCLPKNAKEVLVFLRKFLKKIPILYGGSVNSENGADYVGVGFDGLLVGGASLNAQEFIKIVKSVAK